MDLKIRIAGYKNIIDEIIEEYLPAESGYAKTLYSAMNYSVRAGGKRLRPMLLLEVNRIYGGDQVFARPFAAAIECIHTYSLVHDDLPAMDNDLLRRGKPTTHAQYGEAMGILAGDGLLNLAFELMSEALERASGNQLINGVRAFSMLAHASGSYGMIGGQCADVEVSGRTTLSDDDIDYIYMCKTGALLAAAMGMGAALAGADEDAVANALDCGYALGRAFQIRDDILDVVGDEEILGKPVGSDVANEKPTYVRLHGVEAAEEEVRAQTKIALSMISDMPGKVDFLKELMIYLTDREM